MGGHRRLRAAAAVARKRARFLELYPQTGSIERAAAQAGISFRSHYRWLQRNPEYAEQWRKAVAQAVANAEAEVYRRGYKGVVEPVFQGGEKVGEIRKFSDVLAMYWLNGHAPEKYRRVEHTGPGGGPIEQRVTVYVPQNGREARAIVEGEARELPMLALGADGQNAASAVQGPTGASPE